MTTCCNCEGRADEHQTCKYCRRPACVRCVVYDVSGRVWCPDCAQEAMVEGEFDMGEHGHDEGRWA